MEAILESLTLKQLLSVEDSFANDEDSADEELRGYFIHELRLSDIQASQALTYRPLYQVNLYLQCHSPVFVGEDALTVEMLLGAASAPRKPSAPDGPSEENHRARCEEARS